MPTLEDLQNLYDLRCKEFALPSARQTDEEERIRRNDQRMREWDRLALEAEERERQRKWQSLNHKQKNAIRLLRRKNNLKLKYQPQIIDEEDLPF